MVEGSLEAQDLDSTPCGIYIYVIPSPVAGSTYDHVRHAQESEDVTKKEIVKTISEEIGLTQLKTKKIVQKTFDAIVETLVEEGRIELRNFGVFEVKRRAARKARNPRTGDRVDVPEKSVVTFKPGKEMEERVRKLEKAKAARKAAEAKRAGSSPSSDGDANISPDQNLKHGYEANPEKTG